MYEWESNKQAIAWEEKYCDLKAGHKQEVDLIKAHDIPDQKYHYDTYDFV